MNRGVATKDCLGIAELGGHVQSLKDFSSARHVALIGR
jgi:hypothetical protein